MLGSPKSSSGVPLLRETPRIPARVGIGASAGKTVNIIIGGLKINTAKGELDASPLAHKSGILNLTLAENSANELIAGAFHAGLEKNDVNGAPDETFALNIGSQGDGADAGWGSLTAKSLYGTIGKSSYSAGIGGAAVYRRH